MSDTVRALMAWAAVALVMLLIIATGIGMQEDIRRGAYVLHKLYIKNTDKPTAERRTVMETCQGAEAPDRRWRWYAKVYPAPDVRWQLFEVSGVICHGSINSWKAYPVDRKQIDHYGCFMSVAGLFCRMDADPARHPSAHKVLS